jgi:poly-gamma-glutamate capsule biosynthesis protein CapA/YwtB (metallophosphatase superfamily)
MPDAAVSLFVCGDVMLGRGVDQILAHPGDATLQELLVTDARVYVGLAESVNGPIPAPVDDAWPWGDLLPLLADSAPDVRILNLETAVTSGGRFAPGKGIHYRMSPGNTGCLAACHPDAVVLANNHMLDFGPAGLGDTLATLAAARLPTTGAGRDADAAWQPIATPTRQGRVLVMGVAAESSGVPASWAATAERPGVAYLPGLDQRTALRITDRLAAVRQPGDLAVVSIHWGSNWGFGIEPKQAQFARRLIDTGVDLVHGHSSHHPRPIEVYHGKLILYGCGDLINDYEGIAGYAEYRPDLRPAYLVMLDAGTGELIETRLVPMRARRMRLERAPADDCRWLEAILGKLSVGCVVRAEAGGHLVVTPDSHRR